jgi:D-alanine-D-alanine ligase
MRVLIVHQEVPPNAAVDELDVLVQVEHVGGLLAAVEHDVGILPVAPGFDSFDARLRVFRPDCVFNLVESLEGSDARMVEVPLRLERLGMRYTGAPASAILSTNDKVQAKERLRRLGLPTPDWATQTSGHLQPPYIVKAIAEHASQGMDASSVVRNATLPVSVTIQDRSDRHGITFFAEQYVAGREFNVSLLADSAGPQALPLAEIDFSAFTREQEKIVDYAAKWDEQAFSYHHTPRVFIDGMREAALAEQLRWLALRCWQAFGLRGYARVDFRVDEQGQPWILEVNCNPCLSPDAGFAAALAQADIDWPTALERILDDALRP